MSMKNIRRPNFAPISVNKIRHLLTLEQSKFVTLAALDNKKISDCVYHNLLANKLIDYFNFNQDKYAIYIQ